MIVEARCLASSSIISLLHVSRQELLIEPGALGLGRLPPASASPAVRLQAYATVPTFLCGFMGRKLRSPSCLHGRHLANRAISFVPFIYFICNSEASSSSVSLTFKSI